MNKEINYIKTLRAISEKKKISFELPAGDKKLPMVMRPPTDKEVLSGLVSQEAMAEEVYAECQKKGLDKAKAIDPAFESRAREMAVMSGRIEFVRSCLPYLLEYPDGGRVFESEGEMEVFRSLPSAVIEFLYEKFIEVNEPLVQIKNSPKPPAGDTKT